MEYRTESLLRRTLRVRYPAGAGRVVLRTELDWEHDLEPVDRRQARRPEVHRRIDERASVVGAQAEAQHEGGREHRHPGEGRAGSSPRSSRRPRTLAAMSSAEARGRTMPLRVFELGMAGS